VSLPKLLIVIAIATITTILGYKLFIPQSGWKCNQGNWEKFGNPTLPPPNKPCQTTETTTAPNLTSLKIYFGNSEFEKENQDCTQTYPVKRNISSNTKNPQRTALDMLLEGPTFTEKQSGYLTSINSSVLVQSLVIEKNTAKVDFNNQLNQGVAGSCRVLNIRSQITNTLRQFPNIENVVISVDGQVDDILQP
jgi:spore germination protein GerM